MREGQSEAEAAANPMASFEAAHEGYFRTLGIPIVAGRGLERRDRGNDSKVVVVSESLARLLWRERSPVGERLRFGVSMPWLTVVGVAADVRYRQLERQWHSVYWPPGQSSFGDEPGPGWYTPSALVVRSSLGVDALAGPVRRLVRELDPEIPVEHVRPVTQVLSAELARPRFQTALIALFALVAVALSAAGLYGVLAATGRQRTPEIGLRLALGATRLQAVAPVVRRAALLTAAGLSLGAALSLAGGRAVEALLYGVPALDAFSFATATGLLALVTCAAAAGPIRRAARTDCAETLRGE